MVQVTDAAANKEADDSDFELDVGSDDDLPLVKKKQKGARYIHLPLFSACQHHIGLSMMLKLQSAVSAFLSSGNTFLAYHFGCINMFMAPHRLTAQKTAAANQVMLHNKDAMQCSYTSQLSLCMWVSCCIAQQAFDKDHIVT